MIPRKKNFFFFGVTISGWMVAKRPAGKLKTFECQSQKGGQMWPFPWRDTQHCYEICRVLMRVSTHCGLLSGTLIRKFLLQIAAKGHSG